MEIILSAVWLATVAWLLLRAFSQTGLLKPLLPSGRDPVLRCSRVAVVIPARNEEDNIRRCLARLRLQNYPCDRLQILVVDDNSSDGTAAIVDAIARDDGRIVLLRSPVLPPGWTGKTHACWIGAQAILGKVEWLCFLDADMRPEPDLIAAAVSAAERDSIDLLSLAPRQELVSFAERLMLPCGLYTLAFCQDLARLQAIETDDATATGQFMLIRCEPYRRAGGHAAVRNVISEDVALARLMKRRGDRVELRDGGRLLSTRMYTGWRTLWPGFAKNLIDMLGGPAATVALSIVAIVLAWTAVLLPAWDAASCYRGASGACTALIPALIGSAAVIGLHVAGAIHFRIPAWYGLLFPVGYSVGAAMALDSVRQRLTGRVNWKGRTYP